MTPTGITYYPIFTAKNAKNAKKNNKTLAALCVLCGKTKTGEGITLWHILTAKDVKKRQEKTLKIINRGALEKKQAGMMRFRP